jgi:hypothetical protein
LFLRNATSNPFLERTIRTQSYQRGLWILAIPLFQWSLKGSKLISIHIHLLLLLRTVTIVCSKFFLNSFLSEQGLAIAKHLPRKRKSNSGWQWDLSISYEQIGEVLVDQGKLPEALDATSKAWRSPSAWPSKTNPTSTGSGV